jgi:BioD-like phosphotransacetylase family protein
MMQAKVIVPANARTGNVPVSTSLGTAYRQAGVTIAAQ